MEHKVVQKKIHKGDLHSSRRLESSFPTVKLYIKKFLKHVLRLTTTAHKG